MRIEIYDDPTREGVHGALAIAVDLAERPAYIRLTIGGKSCEVPIDMLVHAIHSVSSTRYAVRQSVPEDPSGS